MWKQLFKVCRNVLAAFSINLIWLILLFLFLSYALGYDLELIRNWYESLLVPINGSGYTGYTVQYNNVRIIWWGLIFAPLWEELLFRFLPLEAVRWAGHWGKRMTLPIIFASSIIFGLLHGAVINIIIQGFGGLLISWVYISGGRYWGAVATHVLWNTMIIYGLPFAFTFLNS